jgi:hypothetical protein
VAPEAVDLWWGAGDPLLGEPTRGAQRVGDAEASVSVLVRGIALTGTERGLLVTARGGFEHVHRSNALFVGSGGRLSRVWSREESAGPTWTSVVTVPEPGGVEALVYFDGFQHPVHEEPDKLEVRALRWDVQRRDIVESAQVSAIAPVYAAVVGRFRNARTAREAKERTTCLDRFWVLAFEQIPGAGVGRYALTAMSTQRPLAEAALEQARRCLGTRGGAVLALP